ncbi:MAG: bifunctional phosphoribosyl-AMP cyclohydrolase/phosphoribosyl-ATP diphosphatase HisIE [Lachnospiraceae bacterium]|nr:bifunctional phosphoribosyl-AMP cyclohydrolase/phosphoribosyl-ATP diphosphatase HisIE [Lachnospiraceae bacterium]
MKKLICNIDLKYGKAVGGADLETVLSEDPVALARAFSDYGADAIIVNDLSADSVEEEGLSESELVQKLDEAHEQALDVLKEICKSCGIPVIGTGNIRRMEDVKKILYAGCDQAMVDLENPVQRASLEEISKKFGKEKILGRITGGEGTEGGYASLSDGEKQQADELVSAYVMDYAGNSVSDFRKENPFVTKPVISFYDTYVCEENEDGEPVTDGTEPEQFVKSLKDELRKDLLLEEVCGVAGNDVNLLADGLMAYKNALMAEDHLEMDAFLPKLEWESLKKDPQGLVPVVVQDVRTNEVLMVAYMDKEAYQSTLKTGKMTYYSRSRASKWVKGETSGHFQYVKSLTADCDLDTILAKVSQVGVACHTGAYSCFFNDIAHKSVQAQDDPLHVFEDVYNVILDRKVHPREGSYTNYLFDKGLDKILKKVGEEATEIVIAAKNQSSNEVTYEISDFLYHMMVLMAEKGITWEEVTRDLANR